MKFGFLIDKKSFECSRFRVLPISDFDRTIEEFYQSAHVSNGWLYGPERQLTRTTFEDRKFSQRGPVNCLSFFSISPTHEIISNTYTEEHLRFLILGYSFLQGLYLTPEGYLNLGRTAYQPGKLNGLRLSGDDYVNGMEAIDKFYLSNNNEVRNQMFSSIHWHLIGQSYHFDWDKFDSQYKALDGLFRISGIKANVHAERPVLLAKKYSLKLPSWAKLDSTGKESALSKQRNELVHEAKYGGKPIGFSYPYENYALELTSFNTKLVAAMLGIDAPYLTADPEDRNYWGWAIKK